MPLVQDVDYAVKITTQEVVDRGKIEGAPQPHLIHEYVILTISPLPNGAMSKPGVYRISCGIHMDLVPADRGPRNLLRQALLPPRTKTAIYFQTRAVEGVDEKANHLFFVAHQLATSYRPPPKQDPAKAKQARIDILRKILAAYEEVLKLKPEDDGALVLSADTLHGLAYALDERGAVPELKSALDRYRQVQQIWAKTGPTIGAWFFESRARGMREALAFTIQRVEGILKDREPQP